jgi:acyl-CoA thioester hydrolase
VTYEKRIEIRWRDCDALQHVNNAVYATYLEECRDGWLEQALGDEAAMWDYVLARVAIDFRREIRLDEEAVVVRATLARIGSSSLTLSEEVRKLDGTLAAEAESVIVARDRESGRSRALTPGERERLAAALPVHADVSPTDEKPRSP